MMNFTDFTTEQLKDYQKQHEDAAKMALNELRFKEANILNEEARKAAEELKWREKHGERV